MRTMVATLSLLAALTACGPRADTETGRAGGTGNAGTDTSITTSKVRDTTVVKADTSIDVDTVKKTDNANDARN